jgi:hypothetical protein
MNFRIGPKEYDCKPNFDFIERVEERFTLLEFLQNTTKGNIKISQVAWVIYSALRANDYEADYRELGQVVTEHLADANLAAIELVSGSLNGGPKQEIKKKKEPKTVTDGQA